MMHSGNKRLKFISDDGRKVVSNTPDESFDLIVVLSSEPDNLLANRFCTKEFFTQAERILTENGVLSIVLPAFGASAEYVSSLLAKRTAAVLKAVDYVFPETLAAPISGHLLIAGKKKDEMEGPARKLLKQVELDHRTEHRVNELSGGEQQRTALARALIMKPSLLLADEPTGNLDEVSADIILELLKRFHTRGATVIIATHDKELIRKTGGRVIHLNQGYMQKTINV